MAGNGGGFSRSPRVSSGNNGDIEALGEDGRRQTFDTYPRDHQAKVVFFSGLIDEGTAANCHQDRRGCVADGVSGMKQCWMMDDFGARILLAGVLVGRVFGGCMSHCEVAPQTIP